MKVIEWFRSLNRRERQTRLYGIIVGASLFVILLVILASIKVVLYEEYVDAEAGIRIKYPINWQVVRRPEGGAVVVFISPRETEWDPFLENANISIRNLWEPMDIDKFSQVAMKQLTGTFKDLVRVVETRRTTMGGRPAYRFAYVGQVEGAVKYLHVWVLKNNQAYIFTYSAAAQDFDKYRKHIQGMIRSFRFL